MVEDDMLGEADETTSEDALGPVVALALVRSEDNRFERSTLAQNVEDLELPDRTIDDLSVRGSVSC